MLPAVTTAAAEDQSCAATHHIDLVDKAWEHAAIALNLSRAR